VIEVACVLGVYVMFLAVGVFSGQTTMSVDIINPVDGMRFQSSPVRLMARVTLRGAPLADIRTRFAVESSVTGGSTTDTITDADGVARLLVPALSGNYTWYATAFRGEFPTIVSRHSSFSVRLSLVVDALSPSTRVLSVSPVDFRAKVTDINGRQVESANVTFYVDMTAVGSSLTGPSGIATLSTPLSSGRHTWFASATKDDEGGLSDSTLFMVG